MNDTNRKCPRCGDLDGQHIDGCKLRRPIFDSELPFLTNADRAYLAINDVAEIGLVPPLKPGGSCSAQCTAVGVPHSHLPAADVPPKSRRQRERDAPYIDDGMLAAIGIVRQEWNDAVEKAFDALSRYKFEMFGYWASKAVSYGQLIEKMGHPKPASPFKGLVIAARQEQTRHHAAGEWLKELEK